MSYLSFRGVRSVVVSFISLCKERIMTEEVKREVELSIPVTEYPKSLGGLHREVCTADSEVGEVVVSSGYGLGNPYLYVSVGGKRVLSVDTSPILEFLVKRAVELASK